MVDWDPSTKELCEKISMLDGGYVLRVKDQNCSKMVDIVDSWCRAYPEKVGRIYDPSNRDVVKRRPLKFHRYASVICYSTEGECMQASLVNSILCFSIQVATGVLYAGRIPDDRFGTTSQSLAKMFSQFILEHCQPKTVPWQHCLFRQVEGIFIVALEGGNSDEKVLGVVDIDAYLQLIRDPCEEKIMIMNADNLCQYVEPTRFQEIIALRKLCKLEEGIGERKYSRKRK